MQGEESYAHLMPRYYFNVLGEFRSDDLIGTELPDLDAAKIEARKDVIEIMRSRFETIGNDWSIFSIEICDDGHNVIFVMPFSRLPH